MVPECQGLFESVTRTITEAVIKNRLQVETQL